MPEFYAFSHENNEEVGGGGFALNLVREYFFISINNSEITQFTC